jgi:hypothetical protein
MEMDVNPILHVSPILHVFDGMEEEGTYDP